MKTALITGANRGLGLEFTKQLLQRGYQVIATCRVPESATNLQELKNENLEVHSLDITNTESISNFTNSLKEQAVDLLINNAGVYGGKEQQLSNFNEDNWSQVLQANSIAPLMLTRALLPSLKLGNSKKIAFLSSKMGSMADNSSGGSYIYRSSKAALNAAARSLALDLNDSGFTTVILHPGWVQTDMGGPNALITAEVSIQGMLKVIEEATSEHSGRFWNYDGAEVTW